MRKGTSFKWGRDCRLLFITLAEYFAHFMWKKVFVFSLPGAFSFYLVISEYSSKDSIKLRLWIIPPSQKITLKSLQQKRGGNESPSSFQ